jgi:uncharacterized glyoxalase superfamily protein PhnB
LLVNSLTCDLAAGKCGEDLARSNDEVDEVIGKAVAAGGSIVRDAADATWGGYFGYFADPDGYLWKVATAS